MTTTPPRTAESATDLSAAVWRALDTVVDPELDTPVTELGFVAALRVNPHERDENVPAGADVAVDLRLPTYFCAPNFAYLMVADAAAAVREVPGVRRTDVRLLDHFAAEEINAGVREPDRTSPGPDRVEWEGLRRTFLRKAHLAAQERLVRRVLRQDTDRQDLSDLRLRDVPEGPELARLRQQRACLELPADPDALLLIDEDGSPVALGDLSQRLRLARTTRIGIEGNAALCRGLLRTRYPDSLNNGMGLH